MPKAKDNVILESDPMATRGIYAILSKETLDMAKALQEKHKLAMVVITVVHPHLEHDASTCVVTDEIATEEESKRFLDKAVMALGTSALKLIAIKDGKIPRAMGSGGKGQG